VVADTAALVATVAPKLAPEDMAKDTVEDSNNKGTVVQQVQAIPPLVENTSQAKVNLVMAQAHLQLARATVLVHRGPMVNMAPAVNSTKGVMPIGKLP